MSLGQLLVELAPLLREPGANRDAIYALLREHQALAEYEVARFLVAKAMGGDLAARLRSVDPRERFGAVCAIPLVCPRSQAAKLLRTVIKDPDPMTRSRARHVMRQMHLADVALADARYRPPDPRRMGPYTPGAYNPSGWAFGVYRRAKRGALRGERLAEHGLPPLATRAEVARWLGAADDAAWSSLLRHGAAPGSAYVEFDVPKATGGARRIAAPRRPLRAAQRRVLDEILAKVPAHAAAHGFVPGRSTVTNAAPHVGAALVVKFDLVDFFPSIHWRRVVGLFEELGYPTGAAEALAGVCTYRPTLADGRTAWPGLLPQGAPSSPAITNLVCRRLDARLAALAAKVGAAYTRYADDLTFSFRDAPDEATFRLGRFFWWVDQICQQEGFAENGRKRRVFRRSAQQRVTGVVVNERLAVPRALRRRLRALIHNVGRNGFEAEARGREDFEAHLHGLVAYVRMVQPELGAEFAGRLREALGPGGP